MDSTAVRPRRAVAADRLLIGLAAVLTGLLAGFFYAYACSVMVGLARVDDRAFVTTMQWINATVRNAAFAPSFFGAPVVTVLAAAVAYRRRGPARHWVLGAAVACAAAFVVTMGVNVPLNEQLAAAGTTDPAAARAAFEGPWVRWNLVRTVLATAALVALVGGGLRSRATAQ